MSRKVLSDSRQNHIEVAIALPVYNTYTYCLPPGLAAFSAVGQRVLVPFGRRRVTGYIMGPSKPLKTHKIKEILDILDERPLFPVSMLDFYRWIAGYYLYPLGLVIKESLPSGLNFYDFVALELTEKGQTSLADKGLSLAEKTILVALENGNCRLTDIFKKLGQAISPGVIKTLVATGKVVEKRKLFGGSTKQRVERIVSLKHADGNHDGLSVQRRNILKALKENGPMSVKSLTSYAATAGRLIASMADAGLVSISEKRVYRDPLGDAIAPDRSPVLTREQTIAVEAILAGLGKGYASFLLAGVTGSGKTEIYLKAAASAIEQGYSVLVLVPEIALISQTERRFRARFGEIVAVLHSGLSAGERFDQWQRIIGDHAKIAVGTRSAVFAPFESLGLIIVDEEHDPSYKQEASLRYNARDLAVMRAKQLKAVTVLGSATPSLQSFFNVETKKFSLLSLTERVEKRPMPVIKVVDLRERKGWQGIQKFVTPQLHREMKATLSRGEQVLLFLNRRGYANFPVCRACGDTVTCRHCDISLTFHKKSNAYRCHFCGYSQAATSECPTCGADQVQNVGLGTEKVEAGIQHLFPGATVARMDRDTTTKKGAMQALLKGLKDRTIDVLIGTQMVAKGHDFPNITLVGIICADLSLNFPDFRAGERTYQLLAQVAGRAGRGDVPGQVVLQTYNPDHFSILTAKKQDYLAFYDHEIKFRKALNYPPFSRLIQIKIAGKSQEKTEHSATVLGEWCQAMKNTREFSRYVDVLGPIEAPLTKIAGHYRYQILVKGAGTTVIHHFANKLMEEHGDAFQKAGVRVVMDVDPVDML